METPLDAQLELIPSIPPEARLMDIPLDDLLLSQLGPDPEATLVASIRQFGVLCPILAVESNSLEAGYRVIDGRRRVKSATSAGYRTIPAMVIPEGSALPEVLQLASHALRSKNTAAEVDAIDRLLQDGASEKEISQATGLAIGEIRARLPMIYLPIEIRDGLANGEIAASIAKSVSKLPMEMQSRLAMAFKQEGKLTASMVKEQRQARTQRAVATLDLDDLVDGPEYTPPPSVTWAMLIDRVNGAKCMPRAKDVTTALESLVSEMFAWADQGAVVAASGLPSGEEEGEG